MKQETQPEEPKPEKQEKPQERKRMQYGNYYTAKVRIKLMTPSIAGSPDLKSEKLVFERDAEGNIYLHNKYWRAIIRDTVQLLNKGIPKVACDKVFSYPATLDKSTKTIEMPFPVNVMGRGKGLEICEALPAGIEIDAAFYIPATVFKPKDFHELLSKAGQFVGFSISKHKMGYGRFQILKYETDK